MIGVLKISLLLLLRLLTFDGVAFRKILSSGLIRTCIKLPRSAPSKKWLRGSLCNLIIESQLTERKSLTSVMAMPLPIKREVSLYAAWFNSSGFEGWNLIQDSRHAKNSQMPERTKTLSPGSLRNLYTAALESKGFKVKISAKLETVKHLFYLKHIKALTQSKL